MDERMRYRLKLVGPFGLFCPAGERIEISSKKGIALIALLAAAPDGVRSRVWLQSMLWGTRDTPQAQSSLRRELATLCGTLSAHGAEHLLVREPQRIRLKLDLVDVDVLEMELGRAASSAASRDDFLEGLDIRGCEEFEDWLREQRSRIEGLQEIHIPQPSRPLPSAHQVLGAALPSQTDLLSTTPPQLPPKPSVAVLPFTHLGRPEDANWLGSGIAHEVGMTLAQYPQLFVVSTHSAVALAERRLTHVEMARQLGVRFLLDGTIRQIGPKLRVSVNLIDGRTGLQVWANSMDGRTDDLFTLQEAVATMAAPRIWTHIDLAERYRCLRERASSTTNYELYWRANALFRSWEREATLEALELTDELTSLDPNCALSSGLAAFCNGVAFAFRWTDDPLATRRAAILHHQNSLRHGASNVESLGYVAGTLISIGGDLSLANRIIDHALSLLPAYQPTLFWGGWVDIVGGHPARGRERLELALRINPASGVRAYSLTGIGVANLMEGDMDGAYAMLNEAAVQIPHYPLTLAALCVAAASTGNAETAARAAAALDAIGGADVALSILQDSDHRRLLSAGLSGVRAGARSDAGGHSMQGAAA